MKMAASVVDHFFMKMLFQFTTGSRWDWELVLGNEGEATDDRFITRSLLPPVRALGAMKRSFS
jgi:hypothetical protein